jgi:hypothetical protein
MPSGRLVSINLEENWLAFPRLIDAGPDAPIARCIPVHEQLGRFLGEEFVAASDSFFVCIGPDFDCAKVISLDGHCRATLRPVVGPAHPERRFFGFEQVLIDRWDRIWISDGMSQVYVYSPDGDILYAPVPGDDFNTYWGNTGWSRLIGVDRQGRLWLADGSQLWLYEFPELAIPDLAPSLSDGIPTVRTGLEPSL